MNWDAIGAIGEIGPYNQIKKKMLTWPIIQGVMFPESERKVNMKFRRSNT